MRKHTTTNKQFVKAREIKNDEFYTLRPYINKELKHYKSEFKNKIVYCNADNEDSNFVKYFKDNFHSLQLCDFIYTSYDKNTGKGSFLCAENLTKLRHADIIVTNPPFSLWRHLYDVLKKWNKKFLIVGSNIAPNLMTMKPDIIEGKTWMGVNEDTNPHFLMPDGKLKRVNAKWYTNLKHTFPKGFLNPTWLYTKGEYPMYDEYEAIECGYVEKIPCNYEGIMGVPLSFLDVYHPDEFEITGIKANLYVNGKKKFTRVLIRNKFPITPFTQHRGKVRGKPRSPAISQRIAP